MTHRVAYWEILGADGKVLRDFYSGLFGWEFSAAEGEAYQRADAGLPGGIGAFPDAPSHITFYVSSDDLGGDVERAASLGGTVVMPPREVTPGVSTALIADPEGHVVGLIDGL